MAVTGDGFLLVDKPAGISSHDAVARVRRGRGGVRAGHTGTLDPFATGLLVVALGAATRLIRFVPSEPKVYRATIAFGHETDTDDATGHPLGQRPLPDEASIRAALPRLTGQLSQVPPAYSARHVEGRRAYQMAREGVAPVLAPALVTVHSWAIESLTPASLTVTITCGTGTYVRSLARDLGRLCGSAAHCATLRRTRIGPFDVARAVPPDESGVAPLIAPADALDGLPRQVVDDAGSTRVRHGRDVPATVPGELAALLDEGGTLLAVAAREGGDRWQPKVVLDGR